MTDEEKLRESSERVTKVLQDAMAEGLLDGDMLTDWVLVFESMHVDYDPETETKWGTGQLAHEDASAPRSLGLIETARIGIVEEIRLWHRNDEL